MTAYQLVAAPVAFGTAGQSITARGKRTLLCATAKFYLNRPMSNGIFAPWGGMGLGTTLLVGDTGTFAKVWVDGYVAKVSVDTLEGTAASHSLQQGWMAVRAFIVDDLNPNNNLSSVQIARDAEAAVIYMTGDRGSPAPGLLVPTYLEEFQVELLSPHNARVKPKYKGYRIPSYRFHGVLENVESNTDYNGKAIVVSYTYKQGDPLYSGSTPGTGGLPAGQPGDPPFTYDPIHAPGFYPDPPAVPPAKAPTVTKNEGAILSRQIREQLFTINFTVIRGMYVPAISVNGIDIPGGGPLTPVEFMSWLWLLDGTVNADSVTVGLVTGTRGKWMIENVDGSSDDGGLTYQASFTLHFRPMGFTKRATFIRPDTGLPPDDLVEGVGWKDVQVAPFATFPTFTFGAN